MEDCDLNDSKLKIVVLKKTKWDLWKLRTAVQGIKSVNKRNTLPKRLKLIKNQTNSRAKEYRDLNKNIVEKTNKNNGSAKERIYELKNKTFGLTQSKEHKE